MSETFHGDPIIWPITGKCSVFGGPDDHGVQPDEDLALCMRNQSHLEWCAHLFLPVQPKGTTGTARRLNPDALYCAMRWNYGQTPVSVLRDGYVIVTNSRGDSIEVKPIDWGPNDHTGRIIDLSPGTAKMLKLGTDDRVTCEFVAVPRRA